ncbi:hypothetical protein D3C80_1217550 [compost metagenome]
MQREVLDAPLAVLDRLQDRAQPGFLAVATQQAERPVEVLATADRAFHALVEIQRLHMGRDNVLEFASKQLVGTVEHLALEVAVDHLDPSLGVELEHQHLAVEAALDLFDRQQVFTQLLDFLLELVVEHSRSPGAQHVIECIFIGWWWQVLEHPAGKYSHR